MENYYMDLNLRRWAIIQYSSHLWKRPELKEYLVAQRVSRSAWISFELLGGLDELPLPCCLKDDLKLAIGSMGREILHWLYDWYNQREISQINRYCIECALYSLIDHVKWDYLGCIDRSKTLESLYKAKLLPMNQSTWRLLCRYCVEDCIQDFWKQVSQNDAYKQLKKNITYIEFPFYRSEAPQYFWILRMQNKLNQLKEMIPDFVVSETTDEFMFRNAHEFNIETIIYFYKCVDNDRKKTLLQRIAATAGESTNWLRWNMSRDLKYSMFIMRLYANNGFQEVINKMLKSPEPPEIFVELSILAELPKWPYQDNFWPAFAATPSDQISSQWTSILMSLTYLMKYEELYLVSISKARKWFCHIWQNRKSYGINGDATDEATELVEELCLEKSIEPLKCIVTCEKSLEKREQFMDLIVNSDAMYDYKFVENLYRKFVEEIDHKEWLKQKLVGKEIAIDKLWDNDI